MTKRAVAIPGLFFLLAVIGAGQSPQFEVASVKPVDVSKLGNAIQMNLGTVRHDEVTFGNATLNDCIRFAFAMDSDAQIVGPMWTKSLDFLYDVVAKGTPGSSREQLQAMMQILLVERFKLVTHRDHKEMSYYALVTAKGSKMRPVPELPDGFRGINFGGRINNIMRMQALAYLLSRFETGRPILDETGLRGLYEVKLEWALRQVQNLDAPPGPSLFTALTEQLGLKLEAKKGPVEILVVDSAEKVPAEN